MGIFTADEIGLIMIALKEYGKNKLKDAALAATFESEKSQMLAQRCRENAAEAEALKAKLEKAIPKLLIKEA